MVSANSVRYKFYLASHIEHVPHNQFTSVLCVVVHRLAVSCDFDGVKCECAEYADTCEQIKCMSHMSVKESKTAIRADIRDELVRMPK